MGKGELEGKEIAAHYTSSVQFNYLIFAIDITADGDFSHEIKRCLLLGMKVMTNLDSMLKDKYITLPTKIHLVKPMVFPSNHVYESWTIKKAEC